MKFSINLIAIAFVLFIFSCKKDKETTPALVCKLTNIDRGNKNTHAYTYDAAGKITVMTRELDPSGQGNTVKYVYNLTYDAAGKLSKAVITEDGKAYSTETYTYTNGKVSKTSFEQTDGTKGVNNFKYDAVGNMTEMTFELGDPFDGKLTYEYNSANILIKSAYSDLAGNKFFESISKPIGSVKNAESLLNSSLPYDLLAGGPWFTSVGGVGTIDEIYYADEMGKLAKADEIKTTDVKTNSKGYITEWTAIDGSGASTTQKFAFIDCL